MKFGQFDIKLRTIAKHGGIRAVRRLDSGTACEKFLITTEDENQFLLRIDPNGRIPVGKSIFNFNKELICANIKIPAVLEAGRAENPFLTYELREWIPGKSLDRLLNNTSYEHQYEKGIAAGKLLKSIHSTRCSGIRGAEPFPLGERVRIATYNYELRLRNGQPTYEGAVFANYLSKHRIPETEEPGTEGMICLLHGDFHTGNIVEDPGGCLWAIDWIFDRFGDPVEDFVRIFVSADRHPGFAKGQIDGYFGGPPSSEFWEKLKMLAALQQLEILSYSLGKLRNGQTVQAHQHKVVLEQYNCMELTVPKFYHTAFGGEK